MPEFISHEVAVLLSELESLNKIISERLNREAIMIQILTGALALVFVWFVIYLEDPVPLLTLSVPPIIGAFSWLCSAEHIKIRRDEIYIRDHIEKN